MPNHSHVKMITPRSEQQHHLVLTSTAVLVIILSTNITLHSFSPHCTQNDVPFRFDKFLSYLSIDLSRVSNRSPLLLIMKPSWHVAKPFHSLRECAVYATVPQEFVANCACVANVWPHCDLNVEQNKKDWNWLVFIMHRNVRCFNYFLQVNIFQIT